MSTNRGILIVGASQAGVQLASSLREIGYADPITIVGAERHAPYQRPPLSKAYLQGKVTAETLSFRTQEYYDKHDIQLVLNERIVAVDKAPDGSGAAMSASGREFAFSRLALTTGARPRRLQIEGADLDGVLYLRDADDAEDMKARMASADNVVVVGGGFIGLEAAASAQKFGKSVSVLEAAPRLVGRAVGEETSEFFLKAHRSRGLDITLNAKIVRFTGESGRVSGVELEDGRVVPADIVLVGIGVVPRTELAEQMGLACGNGVIVDEFSLASDGTTVVAGDCAELPNPMPRDGAPERLRLESVNNAVEQARNAAATVAGGRVPYRMVPWFWSDQGEVKLQMAGLSAGYDQIVTRGSVEDEKFSFIYYREGQVIAADCINNPVDFMAVKALLAKGINVPADRVVDAGTPLKKLVAELAPAS
ncbi:MULTISPECIES: NAD(P)/FAD-dependent oxidoreductase [Citricoccus]|uniref:NAD(P)/FAD-dependent oxidoreductase n=1 Tax=Citricoccus TaxID=169133 RepID=UPI000316EFD5|nr:FAD-dependent oxidoreductase [Citricoccus sp. CH26A]